MEVVRDYRALYGREGWNNNSVYPGVRELLAALNEKGFPLYICTSKHEPSALRVLDHFGLAGLFTAVFADRPDMESHGKTDLLASLLGRQSIDRANAWMVGDRIYDFEAARANGIRSIAAAWGYGSAQEYSQADAVAVTPEQVLELVAPAERNPAVSIFR
jgi:phosphoglycolate phosphatase